LSIPIAVNGSRLQLHDRRVVALWRELVAADPELPRFLVLEVPVEALASDGGSAARTLKELAALGLAVHVAGLGAGDRNFASDPSDLAELARLPLAAVKIDRALIAAIPDDDLACESVRRMTSAARSIGIRIIAEGVESEKAMRFLRGCGCDEAQGYFLGYPMPAEEIGDRASGLPQ
jgi:EAL domain-containing protein (putative c-di-GMP-specific phosphodiesterase class I)